MNPAEKQENHVKNRLNHRWYVPVMVLMAIFCVALPGCRTYQKKTEGIHAAFYRNDLSRATADLKAQREKKDNRKNADLLKLEEAVARMCQGQFAESEKLLREVRDTFDTREDRKVAGAAETAVSMLTDDLALTYPGEDYEKIMIRAMLAINNLMRDGQDVIPYSLQINMKQEEIIQRGTPFMGTGERPDPKKAYQFLPLGPYLTGMIYEQNVTEMHEAARAYAKVCQWAPEFTWVQRDLQRAQTGIHSEPGRGVVYVITLLGKGPRKVQTSAPATQLALLIADRIVSATSKHSVPPTIAPVPIPEIVESPCRYSRVNVTVEGGFGPFSSGATSETITDVNRIARAQFEANRDWIIARAVARRVVKKAGVYAAKEALDVKNPAGEILLDVAGVLWEATEEADTRCWSLLPGKIQVARVDLPVGTHTFLLNPQRNGSESGKAKAFMKEVKVEDGRNTYVLAYIADDGLIGEIQVSGGAAAY